MSYPQFNCNILKQSLIELFLNNEQIIIQAFTTDDIIGSVLRTHLVCEQFLAIWIYASCNQTGFLESGQISFHNKLKMAENLELPDYAVKIFNNINKIRNRIAHNIQQNEIDRDILQSTHDVAQKAVLIHFPDVMENGIQLCDKNETPKYCLTLAESRKKPHQYLALILFLTIHRVAYSQCPDD
ncbi:hypothetical protein EII21_05820 [Conchiformibius steedae]|uniref:DUF4145 domain-containing protein n=2 Tax=Conchiformibius steedae TaxID=153493 RepID=A0A3P2A4V2_9NEIS|nr:hypothetical protein EII21_05820 [Conchiformibius steedae]